MTNRRLASRYSHQAVGLLVLTAMALFIAAIFGSGQMQHWINPGARLKVILPASGLFGLAEGGAVQILGINAGKVEKIIIDPAQQIYAEVLITHELKTFVRRDSRAIIRRQFGVAGAALLEITRGYGEPMDWDFAVLQAKPDRAPTESVGELIDELRQKVFPVIDDAHTAIRALTAMLNRLEDPQGPMQQLLVNLSTITANIVQGRGTVGRLIADENLGDDLQDMISKMNAIVGRIIPHMNELTATIHNVAGISEQIHAQSRDLPEMTQHLKEALVAANQVFKDLRQASPELPRIAHNMGQVTTNLPLLLLQVQQVMVELEQLLKQLQAHWLLGNRKAVQERSSHRISPLEVHP